MDLCIVGQQGHVKAVLAELTGLPRVRIVGVAPGTPGGEATVVPSWCDRHGHEPRRFEDAVEMLDALRPDAVCIDNPFHLHADVCVAALERGVHVLCEKPVATTLEGLSRVEAAGERSSAVLMTIMKSRYDPAIYTAWQAVRKGAIGPVRLIDCRKSYRLGQRPEFYRSRETYGGTILWVGIHAVDWIVWFSGQRFESAWATHTTADNRGHGDLESAAACQLVLADGTPASVMIDYFRPDTAPTHGDDRIRVVGVDGVIEVREGRAYLINGEASGERRLAVGCDRGLVADFLGVIERGEEGLIRRWEVFEATRACLAARASADGAGVVRRSALTEVDAEASRSTEGAVG